MTDKQTRILYMEDDAGTARLLEKRLRRQGFVVEVATNGELGLEAFSSGTFDALAIDQSMPVMDGLDVIRELAERRMPLPPIVMVTGAGNESLAVEAMKLGASDYIVKDIDGGWMALLPAVLNQAILGHQLREEKRRAEEDRKRLIDELDAFASTVAHDLKNPITTILNYSSFLRRAELDEAEREDCIRIIEQTGHRMHSIIDELLLLSQVRKVEDLHLTALDMGPIVLAASERLLLMMKTYQAQLKMPDEWPLAYGYAPWIEEVWANYLSNAIKYGGEPPVIEVGACYDDDGMVRFFVRDNGDGIPQALQNQLFTPFTRLNQVRASGHGLGLSIVQRIVEKLHGEVGVDDADDGGSIFYFRLPRA